MKPEGWDKLSKAKKLLIAKGLLNSERGSYLISQALHHARKTMSKVPERQREVSNIEDMEILEEIFFPIFKSVLLSQEEIKKMRK